YLQGKRSGSTNVTLYSDDKRLLEVIEVRVRIDYSDLSKALRSAVPSAQVNVTNINDRIRLSGVVKDNRDLGRVLEIASQYAPADTQVINAIRVASPQQVELDVRIIEVSRNAGRELGVNLDGSKPNGGSSGFSTGGTPNRTPFGVAVGQLLEISGFQV